jgi:tRNA A-37 threonylcarbamoyl transferase component Bud32
MFFGRQETLRQIAEFLNGNQSVSLVGPRKIGKTSLLYHLMRPQTAQELGLGENRLFCYMDCEGMGTDSPAEVLQQFAAELHSELELRGGPEEPALEAACANPSRLAFEGAVRALGKQDLAMVIILDEFERLSQNPNLEVNFFNALRSMASRFPLAFITASALPLIELTFSGRSQEILSSPFFNIFAPIFLGGLAEDEARALIWVPAEKAQCAFPAPLHDSLYRFSGGHPFFLQVACFHAFHNDASPAEIERQALEELDSHFEYCWRNLNEPERKALLAHAAAAPMENKSEPAASVLRDLEKKGLLEQHKGRWSCASGALRLFLAGQTAPSNSRTQTAPARLAGKRYPSAMLGAYEILEPIGKGGMAEVFKARHIRLDRPAAIKILSPHLAPEADFRERFAREARALAALKHPNIIQIFDYGDEEGLYYIAMEYIAGRDLGYRLSLGKRLPTAHTWRIAVELAAALDFAHARGIIHRDVKPANVLLEPMGHGENADGRAAKHPARAILTDFGIAKLMAEDSQATQAGLYGTVDYMSPEQIRADANIDGRADIYALGVMLFRMLTGHPAFAAASSNLMMMAHLETPPPDARTYAPDLPEKVALALQRAMAKDPIDRFSSAGEFVGAMK